VITDSSLCPRDLNKRDQRQQRDRVGTEALRLQRLDIRHLKPCQCTELSAFIIEHRRASSPVEQFTIHTSEILVFEGSATLTKWIVVGPIVSVAPAAGSVCLQLDIARERSRWQCQPERRIRRRYAARDSR
jgi:hypothetical protein